MSLYLQILNHTVAFDIAEQSDHISIPYIVKACNRMTCTIKDSIEHRNRFKFHPGKVNIRFQPDILIF